jgi:hypothetical protein
MLGGISASVRGQESTGASKRVAVISSVAITHDRDRASVRVEGSGRLAVQATRIQNPERLALDFAEARLKVHKTSIPGVSAPVRGVRMGQFRPDVARVVIDLTASVPYQIAHEGEAVVVYLQVPPPDTNATSTVASAASEKPQKQIAAAATTPPTNSISNKGSNTATASLPLSKEPTQPANNAPVQLAIVRGQDFSVVGTTVAAVSCVAMTQDTQRTAIRIEGSGRLEVQATRIQNPERLALDFAGARLKVLKTSIPGVSAPVRGVRMGQFQPDVARVVIDLTTSVPYQIAHEGGSVVVYLQVQPSATNASPAVASAASEKPQKQIAVTASTPLTNSISIINKSNSATTAPLPSSNEPIQPSATSAASNAPVEPSPMENGGDFSRSPVKKLPTEAILVKGAWSSASDSITPVPEGGSVNNSVYNNPYFGLRYSLAASWTQKYSGPPPSDSGYYVLAQIRPAERSELPLRGSILIAAQDLFFTSNPSSNAVKLIQEISDNLEPDYKVELPPTVVQLANHPFVRFDYGSPVADLHWHILATQIHCHVLEFIFTSRDAKLAEGLIRGMNMIELPSAARTAGETDESNVPVCIKDYASGENVIEKVNPIITERRFNSSPVRIIIDKEGKVKHIHFLSAFPDQTKVITDALLRWKFRPYMRNGRPVEVETGIMFGIPPLPAVPPENALRE